MTSSPLVSERAVSRLMGAAHDPSTLAQALSDVLRAEGTVNVMDVMHNNPVHLAAEDPQRFPGALQIFLDAGVDFSLADKSSGNTPLHRAAENGQLKSIDRLVLAGAALAVRNAKGKTPLALALCGGQGEGLSIRLNLNLGPQSLERIQAAKALLDRPEWVSSTSWNDQLESIFDSPVWERSSRDPYSTVLQELLDKVVAVGRQDPATADAVPSILAAGAAEVVRRNQPLAKFYAFLRAGADVVNPVVFKGPFEKFRTDQPSLPLIYWIALSAVELGSASDAKLQMEAWSDHGGRWPPPSDPGNPLALIRSRMEALSAHRQEECKGLLQWMEAASRQQRLTKTLETMEPSEPPRPRF